MSPFLNRGTLLVTMLALATSACGGRGSIPSGAPAAGVGSFQASNADASGVSRADTTSILKKLTKDVTIGSTIDPGNGDTGPRAISSFPKSKHAKGQLLVCNFDDSSGSAGRGTTIEKLDLEPNSKPTTFVQSSKIEGCDGAAITSEEQVYASGLTSKAMVWIDPAGLLKKTYGSPITDPLGDGDAAPPPGSLYIPEYVFVGNADSGAVDNISLGLYGTGRVLEVIKGFPVDKGSGWSALGPSAMVYNAMNRKAEVLYVVDGACNAVVAVQNPTSLLEKDEITVQPGCKSFKCLHPKTTCGTLVKAGAPLDAPVAETLLPNGNLIVANTKGGNTLVELTPSGQVLDTRVVDKSKTAGIFGLLATGTSDTDTALYYTDTNSNTLQELER